MLCELAFAFMTMQVLSQLTDVLRYVTPISAHVGRCEPSQTALVQVYECALAPGRTNTNAYGR